MLSTVFFFTVCLPPCSVWSPKQSGSQLPRSECRAQHFFIRCVSPSFLFLFKNLRHNEASWILLSSMFRIFMLMAWDSCITMDFECSNWTSLPSKKPLLGGCFGTPATSEKNIICFHYPATAATTKRIWFLIRFLHSLLTGPFLYKDLQNLQPAMSDAVYHLYLLYPVVCECLFFLYDVLSSHRNRRFIKVFVSHYTWMVPGCFELVSYRLCSPAVRLWDSCWKELSLSKRSILRRCLLIKLYLCARGRSENNTFICEIISSTIPASMLLCQRARFKYLDLEAINTPVNKE